MQLTLGKARDWWDTLQYCSKFPDIIPHTRNLTVFFLAGQLLVENSDLFALPVLRSVYIARM